jgi:DNA topoisomerase-1
LKNLIIVESPTKARTIENFLGKDYTVIASKGHIRDLPKSSFGIKIEGQEFIPEYRVSRDHSKVVKEIKDLAKKSDQVYIATDEDREGEAIGYHIAKAIGANPEEIPRIVFHEITKKAIDHSLKNPRKIDLDSVNAQQARRLLDRIVGYKLSPLIASKIQKGLSAGRVQSAALKIVVDREREIKAFVPVEYWSIDAVFNKTIDSILVEYQGEKIEKMTISNEERAKGIESTLKNDSYKVEKIEKRQRKTSTNPPFMTSTLQQTASSVLGFSPRKTMMVAQTLYEGVQTDQGTMGVITYMRTDSLNIAQEAIDAAREKIKNEFGDKYLPEKPKYYKSKSKGAQEAHEAIRPTILSFTPQIAKQYLKPDELKLYTLIYNRFVASQMTDAIFESQSIIFASENGKFKATGRKLIFDGFYKVLGTSDKDKLLPDLSEGQEVELSELKANQHFT